MKYCPTCQSQYTDDTLKFCLQDGTPLQNALFSQLPSEAQAETETIVAPRPTGDAYAARETDAGVRPTSAPSAPPARSKTATAVFLTAFVMLVFFALAGVGLWFYFNGLSRDKNANLLLANANRSNQPTATRSSELAKATPQATVAANTATTSANANTNTNTNAAPPVDREQIKEDVGARVEQWAAQLESFDLDDYMRNYAETVDYYTRKSASRAFIRADKERAFAKFDEVKMKVGNLAVTPDATGTAASAVFDKEWRFSGENAESAGKVQTELQFKKIGGAWLITSERDLKVYYTE